MRRSRGAQSFRALRLAGAKLLTSAGVSLLALPQRSSRAILIHSQRDLTGTPQDRLQNPAAYRTLSFPLRWHGRGCAGNSPASSLASQMRAAEAPQGVRQRAPRGRCLRAAAAGRFWGRPIMPRVRRAPVGTRNRLHRPFHTGLRFSAKAFRASTRSSELNTCLAIGVSSTQRLSSCPAD